MKCPTAQILKLFYLTLPRWSYPFFWFKNYLGADGSPIHISSPEFSTELQVNISNWLLHVFIWNFVLSSSTCSRWNPWRISTCYKTSPPVFFPILVAGSSSLLSLLIIHTQNLELRLTGLFQLTSFTIHQKILSIISKYIQISKYITFSPDQLPPLWSKLLSTLAF